MCGWLLVKTKAVLVVDLIEKVIVEVEVVDVFIITQSIPSSDGIRGCPGGPGTPKDF